MMKPYILFVTLGVLIFTASCEKKPAEETTKDTDTVATHPKEEKKELSNEDKDFINDEIQDGMLEVELGKIAHEKGTHKDVKEYGHMLETEHTSAGQELKDLAAQKNVTVSDSLSSDGQDKVKKLKETKASDFDKKYISEMVENHKKDINEFEERGSKTEDPELKSWIEKTLPHLKHHLADAQKLDSTLQKAKKK